MSKLFRTAVFFAVAILYVPLAPLFVHGASKQEASEAGSKPKIKKQKQRKPRDRSNRKKLILKGHHQRHKGRPA
jgi:hypothetical protein